MIRIACIQFDPLLESIEQNIRFMVEAIESTEADLLVFPELATTGYYFRTRQAALPFAATLKGGSIDALRTAARKAHRTIVFGFLELDTKQDRLFNSSLLVNYRGEVAGHYRKIHLFYKERLVFEEGDLGLPVFDVDIAGEIVNLGMMICYDWRFPEAARTLALKGADIIVVPANIVTTTPMLHPTLQTRAFENKVIVVFADRVGSETREAETREAETREAETREAETLHYRGESSIINFNGAVVASAGNRTEVIIASVDPAATRSKSFNKYNDIISDRRPELYR